MTPLRRLALLAPGALLLAALAAPALAISDRRDQPTQADIPNGTGTTSEVAPPQALKPGTQVMPGDTGLTGSTNPRTNPLDHIDPKERRATGGGNGAGDGR
ncbi:hypothetical protein OPKNFCMD_2782 [Methylobacterium crusticola]|uniref:Uncharacterized protein n=1 Tax=Methylobacterium crusticola TaxID=1697972 RepID=A0ABQ4QZH9_9HYPH|nr:hypothetical protein [Methylobacterium crusticola]GJD50046.1 hypothetical protein OPKNFCMD_2782 [Methylobacterium crusticola]